MIELQVCDEKWQMAIFGFVHPDRLLKYLFCYV